MTKVKICGITCLEDIEIINEAKPDYAGFVMFFPKSKRNISCEKAKELLASLDKNIASVAVTVSPTYEQIREISDCGYDFVQIHGAVNDDILRNPFLKVLLAFNVFDIDRIGEYNKNDNIAGYVFDAAVPGSGKAFDWNILNNINCGDKVVILAGGLNPDNVSDAIRAVTPDCVDVSSGVENDNGIGKSRDKVLQFIGNVRLNEEG